MAWMRLQCAPSTVGFNKAFSLLCRTRGQSGTRPSASGKGTVATAAVAARRRARAAGVVARQARVGEATVRPARQGEVAAAQVEAAARVQRGKAGEVARAARAGGRLIDALDLSCGKALRLAASCYAKAPWSDSLRP